MDVKAEFLNRDLNEDLYIKQLKEVVDQYQPIHVCKILSAL